VASTSRIPAAKAALLALLQARAALQGPGIAVTYNKLANPPADWVWVRNARGQQRAAAMGQQRREETFRIFILFSVVRGGRDVQTVGERAFALVAELEAQLRTDASLGQVVRVAEIEQLDYEEFQDEKQCEGRVTAQVKCSARI
jgi:hypothetical protein